MLFFFFSDQYLGGNVPLAEIHFLVHSWLTRGQSSIRALNFSLIGSVVGLCRLNQLAAVIVHFVHACFVVVVQSIILWVNPLATSTLWCGPGSRLPDLVASFPRKEVSLGYVWPLCFSGNTPWLPTLARWYRGVHGTQGKEEVYILQLIPQHSGRSLGRTVVRKRLLWGP